MSPTFREGFKSGLRISGPFALLIVSVGACLSPSAPMRWVFGVGAGFLAASMTYFIWRIENDYEGVRRIFRNATKAAAVRAEEETPR